MLVYKASVGGYPFSVTTFSRDEAHHTHPLQKKHHRARVIRHDQLAGLVAGVDSASANRKSENPVPEYSHMRETEQKGDMR